MLCYILLSALCRFTPCLSNGILFSHGVFHRGATGTWSGSGYLVSVWVLSRPSPQSLLKNLVLINPPQSAYLFYFLPRSTMDPLPILSIDSRRPTYPPVPTLSRLLDLFPNITSNSTHAKFKFRATRLCFRLQSNPLNSHLISQPPRRCSPSSIFAPFDRPRTKITDPSRRHLEGLGSP
jgi:hypothetical protein